MEYVSQTKYEWNFVAGTASNEKLNSIEVELNPGIYRAVVIMDWINSKIYDVNISYYGSEKIEIVRIPYKNEPNFLAEAMVGETKLHG